MARFVGTKVEFGADKDEFALNLDVRGQPEEFASTTPSWKKWPATPLRWPR